MRFVSFAPEGVSSELGAVHILSRDRGDDAHGLLSRGKSRVSGRLGSAPEQREGE